MFAIPDGGKAIQGSKRVTEQAIPLRLCRLRKTRVFTQKRGRAAEPAIHRPAPPTSGTRFGGFGLPRSPTSPNPCRNAVTRWVEVAADVFRRKPTTGIPGCCARTVSGQAAALLTKARKVDFA